MRVYGVGWPPSWLAPVSPHSDYFFLRGSVEVLVSRRGRRTVDPCLLRGSQLSRLAQVQQPRGFSAGPRGS